MPLPALIGGALFSLQTTITTWIVLSLPGIVFVVLRTLGIGFVSYTGVDFVVSQAENFIYARMGELPSSMLDIMNLAGFDIGIRMLFAAWSAQIAVRITMGAFNSWSTKPSVLRA